MLFIYAINHHFFTRYLRELARVEDTRRADIFSRLTLIRVRSSTSDHHPAEPVFQACTSSAFHLRETSSSWILRFFVNPYRKRGAALAIFGLFLCYRAIVSEQLKGDRKNGNEKYQLRWTISRQCVSYTIYTPCIKLLAFSSLETRWYLYFCDTIWYLPNGKLMEN